MVAIQTLAAFAAVAGNREYLNLPTAQTVNQTMIVAYAKFGQLQGMHLLAGRGKRAE